MLRRSHTLQADKTKSKFNLVNESHIHSFLHLYFFFFLAEHQNPRGSVVNVFYGAHCFYLKIPNWFSLLQTSGSVTGNRYNSTGEKLPTPSSTTIPLIQGYCHFKHDKEGDPIFTTNFNIFNDEILVSNDSQDACC